MKKRLLSILLILALCLSLVPAAFADDGLELAEETEIPLIELVEPDAEEKPAGADASGGPEDEAAPEDPELLPAADEANGVVDFGACGDNLTWKLDDSGTLTISGSGPMDVDPVPWHDYRAAISTVVINSGVTTIGDDAFAGCRNLTSVTIPNSVTSIGDYTFYICSSLTSVTIPNSVTSIGNYTFYNCGSLTSVTIPNSVTSIGDYTFCYCSSLTSVTIPSSVKEIGSAAFCRCGSLQSISVASGSTAYKSVDGVLFTKDGARLCCYPIGKSGSSYSIPSGVTTIGEYAFFASQKLTSVTIPTGTTAIGEFAFCGCQKLTTITVPGGVTTIGEYAFSGCEKLTNVVVPDSVTVIGMGAFSSCVNLTSVTIPNSMTRIESYVFSYSGLTSVTIPSGVTYIGWGAFNHCLSLNAVTFQGSAPEIEYEAFSGVTATVRFPSDDPSWTSNVRQNYGGTLTWVPYGAALSGTCGKNLTWTLDDEGKMTISGTGDMWDFEQYFWDYSDIAPWYDYRDLITSVVVNEGATSIGEHAFLRCRNLKSVSLPDTLVSIGQNAFCGSAISSVLIPGRVEEISSLAFADCQELKSITVNSSNTVYKSVDGVLFTKDGAKLCCYPAGKSDSSYAIPNGVSAIGDCAFYYSQNLSNVTIPSSVTVIGVSAFCNSQKLKSAAIPSGIKTIQSYTFSGCVMLASVTLPDGLETICDHAFMDSGLSSVTIPNGVTEIGSGAFANTKLTSITIPASVTEIGDAAFAMCSNLKSISVNSGNPSYKSLDGVLFTKSGTTLLAYPIGKSAASYSIPDGVVFIGWSAFCDASNLSAVKIPDSVEEIERYAFERTGLTSVTIPESVYYIGYYAFGFSNLNRILFQGAAPNGIEDCFPGVTATAYYPADDLSWGEDVWQDCLGNLTWKPYTPLTAPVLTEAFNSATGVRVSWNAVNGAVKYELLRRNVTLGETQWKIVGETTECTLIDKTAKSSNRYTYTVRAVDAEDNEGPIDETGRTCTYIAKADITDITVTADGVKLTWSKPAGAKNFRVMRRVDGAAKWTVLDVVLGTEYLDTTAEKGVKYWYTVRGVSMDNTVLINSYNGTGWSMKPLNTPVLTEAFNSATGVRVSWKPNDGAVKFRLLRKNLTLGETEWHTVGETAEPTLIDTTAKSASRYTYTVECVDSNGRICSAQGNPRTCTYIAMAKITSIGGVTNGVKLTWSKPAGAKNFRVFRKVDGENTWTALTDVQGTTYTDTTAEKGVKYWYTVRAITMDGKMYINSYNSYGWSVTRK
ncbi:MAG: leucine-rich repeat protein [Oscillospiraceae bacterium]|nr:leucine-rich repeat protein [Oscillospiraceae bacterium]